MLAALLATQDYGIWGVTVISMSVVAQLQQVGIGDKYIQQDDPDQEAAFQKAFSLSVLMGLASLAATFVVLPAFALFYDEPRKRPSGSGRRGGRADGRTCHVSRGFAFLRRAVRAILPTVPAVGVILLMRVAESGERTPTLAATELTIYLTVTALATWMFERALLSRDRGLSAVVPAPAA